MDKKSNEVNSIRGLVFDVEEFAVYDGPGIRTTVFMKGCPLRCNWCHNPEGLALHKQRVVSELCTRCGKCKTVCPSPNRCVGCGKCVHVCPNRCVRIAGSYYTPEELSKQLRKNADILTMSGGGITFSGGECTLQTDFLIAVIDLLPELPIAIETCGHCPPEKFRRLIEKVDLVMFDIKHTNSELHKKYTGVDNTIILQNLNILIQSGVSFIARIPVIPGVNDSVENFSATAELLKSAPGLLCVELLPYHSAAGAKYKSVGMKYEPIFDTTQEPQFHTEVFETVGIPVKIL